jgi:hypothetical protein
VRAAGDHQIAVRLGLLREREERGGGLELHELQRAENLELLDVFGEVAAGEAEVDELARPARKIPRCAPSRRGG